MLTKFSSIFVLSNLFKACLCTLLSQIKFLISFRSESLSCYIRIRWRQSMCDRNQFAYDINLRRWFRGSGCCGSVGRANGSATLGPGVRILSPAKFMLIICLQSTVLKKTKIKKRGRNSSFYLNKNLPK